MARQCAPQVSAHGASPSRIRTGEISLLATLRLMSGGFSDRSSRSEPGTQWVVFARRRGSAHLQPNLGLGVLRAAAVVLLANVPLLPSTGAELPQLLSGKIACHRPHSFGLLSICPLIIL